MSRTHPVIYASVLALAANSHSPTDTIDQQRNSGRCYNALSVERWIKDSEMIGCEYLWPSRLHASPHLSTRQYARIMRNWVLSIGLEPSAYGTP